MLRFFKRLKEDFKAFRRKQKPLVNKFSAVRGRIYESKIVPPVHATPIGQIKAQPTVKLDMKIIRADNTVEYHTGLTGSVRRTKEIR